MTFVLFVPSYGGGGSGEFVRAITLAQAAAERWPSLRIEFLLPGGAGTRQDAPFPSTCHDGRDGPDDPKGAFDREHIARLRPDLVIFDSGCRSATLRLCRRLGIQTVYISDRAGTGRKAFRLDWLWTLDEHWHESEHVPRVPFTASQRLRARFSSTRRMEFDTYFAEPPADRGELAPDIIERLRSPFVLFTPGGGGFRVGGRPVGEIFLEAAERVHAATGIEVLSLLGPLYQGNASSRTVIALKNISQGSFVDLMRRCTVLVGNGGHTLKQALALGVPCVAAPLGAADQPGRIAAAVSAGLTRACAAEVGALTAEVLKLLDPAANAALRERVRATGVVNGLPMMLEAIARLRPELAS